MTSTWLRFWGSAAALAVAFTLIVPLLIPYESIGLVTEEDRRRGWVVVVFCTGVLAVLFGGSALLSGGMAGIGIRDVKEAGSVTRALEEARERRKGASPRNFATWLMAWGGLLVGCYFVLWVALT